jgi:hypothetical protein
MVWKARLRKGLRVRRSVGRTVGRTVGRSVRPRDQVRDSMRDTRLGLAGSERHGCDSDGCIRAFPVLGWREYRGFGDYCRHTSRGGTSGPKHAVSLSAKVDCEFVTKPLIELLKVGGACHRCQGTLHGQCCAPVRSIAPPHINEHLLGQNVFVFAVFVARLVDELRRRKSRVGLLFTCQAVTLNRRLTSSRLLPNWAVPPRIFGRFTDD